MNKKHLIYILFFISIITLNQNLYSQWRDHLPYNLGIKTCIAGDDIYLLTQVGLLKYNTKTEEVEKISKINGLNDNNITSLHYNEKNKVLTLGYSNGNIDIIKDKTIINISDIKRKSINGDKTIYSICNSDDYTYLGCGFGIVVLNINKLEIKETWYIGFNGTNVKINDIDIDANFIYAATDLGIYRGELSKNLADFAQWDIISNNISNPDINFSWTKNKSYNCIIKTNNNLIVNFRNNNIENADTLLVYDGTTWKYLDKNQRYTHSITHNKSNIVLCESNWINIYDSLLNFKDCITTYIINGVSYNAFPRYCSIDSNGGYWIADNKLGLIYMPNLWTFKQIKINGPEHYSVFDIAARKDEVCAVAGSMDLSWTPQWKTGQYYSLIKDVWSSYYTSHNETQSPLFDLVRIAFSPNDNSFFCASFGNGLLEFRDNKLYKVHDHTNSTLAQIGNLASVRVGGLCFDKDGNLWVTVCFAQPQIHVLSKSGKWSSLTYNILAQGINYGKILAASNNYKWVIIPRGYGLFIFDDNGSIDNISDDKYKKISLIDEDGAVISNEIFSIAEDKNGYIWIGTNKGVAVFYHPEDIFKTENPSARKIKVPRNNGTNEADILLANEIVTSIVVDGANRKWFGTQNGGVYYTSADGVEQIHHFTTDNSPLLSNNILSIAIMPNTGEVFFGTSNGIISYRNNVTEGNENYNNVYVFPNPVKYDYIGDIIVTGLVENSYVKITDLTGNIVFETKSQGGQAIWNGKNANGNKVRTGIYLVFSADKDGQLSNVTKILFTN